MIALPAVATIVGKAAIKGGVSMLAGCIIKGVYRHVEKICRMPRKVSEMEKEVKYLNEALYEQERGFLELYERIVQLEKKEAE